MDFPHSVPNVALLNGRFTDGNPLVGISASRDPAAWANAVTDEILNVIRAADMTPAEAEVDQLLRGINTLISRKVPNQQILSFSASEVLEANQMGLILLDAAGGSMTVELPVSDTALGVRDVILRRVDNTGNRLVIQASGTDRIKFHTHLRAEGYPFLVLMGSGDYWHLRSDGAGAWWPVARFDSDALGRPVFETTTLFSPGGWGALAGSIFNRTEWPWLWDHAQQSGMLVADGARLGKEGGWTSGDGVATFRGPEARGEFLRILDDGRGVDAGRKAGSSQASQNLSHSHGATAANGGAHTHAVSGSATVTASRLTSARQVSGSAASITIPASGESSTGVMVDGYSVSGPYGVRFTNTRENINGSISGTAASAGGHAHAVTVNAAGGNEARPRSIAYPGRIKLI